MRKDSVSGNISGKKFPINLKVLLGLCQNMMYCVPLKHSFTALEKKILFPNISVHVRITFKYFASEWSKFKLASEGDVWDFSPGFCLQCSEWAWLELQHCSASDSGNCSSRGRGVARRGLSGCRGLGSKLSWVAWILHCRGSITPAMIEWSLPLKWFFY